MHYSNSTSSGDVESLKAGPTPGAPQLTDANMFVINDNTGPVTVTFSDTVAVNKPFSGSVTIQAESSASTRVAATKDPKQSHFTVHFASGDTMAVDIGQGIYHTSASPSILTSGKGGAILAPGKPFSTGTDYDFYFFNGPGILTPLLNGLFQVWIPIILETVAKKPITLYSSGNVKVELTGLAIANGTTIQCAYASMYRSASGNGDTVMLNSLFNLGNTTANFTITLKGVATTLNVSVKDMMIFLGAEADLSLETPPKIDTLKFSLGDYKISGTYIKILETIAPLLYTLLTGTVIDPYRLAGFLNTDYNANIINALNSALKTEFNKIKPTVSLLGQIEVAELATEHNAPLRTDSTPSNGLDHWMSTPSIQAKTLGTLKFPGTHDSPTFSLTSTLSSHMNGQLQFLKRLSPSPQSSIKPDKPIYTGQPLYDFIMGQCVDSVAQAQDTTITTQLMNGMRYFDLRLYYDPVANDSNYQHTIAGTGFAGILDQFATFLQRPNTNELVFALISDTNFGQYQDQMANFISLIEQKIGSSYIYCPSSEANYDLDNLADTTISSITNGTSKIMFIFGDTDQYTFPNTIVNSVGFPQNPWTDYMGTIQDLENRESPTINDHSSKLWCLRWSLDANRTLIPQYVIDRFSGLQNWVLRDGAVAANSDLTPFVNKYGGANAEFNLVTCDWFELGIDVAQYVIGLN